ncbi:type-2 ice-structuring protein-like [Micropterus dolomieu]|uniref:type-2 ice-structuring protein-like n=1 Tax=Micropterus dolomieu TaxID=147949 RepID=UPI001E8E3C1C|nr:type-2 ice-structuring protein-like [Micropterus dolomieu]
MKILTVSALVCAMMALTRAAGAAALSEANPENAKQVKSHLVKRWRVCSDRWTEISGRCFLFVPRAMTWSQAERNCQSLGANLASVHAAEEYRQIQRLISNKAHRITQAWLGATDAAQEGVWFWSDGTPFAFSYWCKGEPNNAGYQHCLQMNHGGDKCWDDIQCHSHLASVCVKKSFQFLG